MLNKISSNTYAIKLPSDLHINPIFNILELYSFEGFDSNVAEISDQVQQPPKAKIEVIKDVLDVKEVCGLEGVINNIRYFW